MSRRTLFLFIFLGLVGLALMQLKHRARASETGENSVVSTPVCGMAAVPACGEKVATSVEGAKSVTSVSANAKTAVAAAQIETPKLVPAIPKDEAPRAVLDWSTDLGRGMLDAFKDSSKADKMFSFLRNCAEDKSVGLTYRAVCAGNAKRLSDRFPEKFSQNYNGFQRGLPERIQKFLAQANTNF